MKFNLIKILVLTFFITLMPITFVFADSTYIDIEWTAPGDNRDIGCVSGYCIAWSYDSTISSFIRDSCIEIIPDSIVCAGEIQTHRFFNIPSDTIIYIAVWSYDKVLNWSGISNIAGYRTLDNISPDSIIDLKIIGSGLISYREYRLKYELAINKKQIPDGIIRD